MHTSSAEPVREREHDSTSCLSRQSRKVQNAQRHQWRIKLNFDIIVADGLPYEKVLEFGKAYLKGVGQEGQPLSAKECEFFHIEQANSAVNESIRAQGFHIVEMDGFR